LCAAGAADGKDHGGADDAEADLRPARDREVEGIAVQTADRTELIADNDRRGVAGQSSTVRGKIP
jgi:hypothetical protein